MSTSSEFYKKRAERRMIKRRKQRRTVAVLTFILLIIIVCGVCVKSNFKKTAQTGSFSEKELAVYPPAPEKNVDILAAIPDNDGIKTAYLTFDDGPTTSVTPEILDILRRYDVKATFFMVGSLIEKNPSVAYRVYNEGHTLANHSYRHNYSYLYENNESFMSEISTTQGLIENITGRADYPKIFRFPGGGYNSGSYGEAKQGYKELLKSEGYRFADWNCLSGDAEYKSPDVQTLLNRVKSSSKGKEDLVILMHDSATKKINTEALPRIIDYLLSEGYTFATLDKAP